MTNLRIVTSDRHSKELQGDRSDIELLHARGEVHQGWAPYAGPRGLDAAADGVSSLLCEQKTSVAGVFDCARCTTADELGRLSPNSARSVSCPLGPIPEATSAADKILGHRQLASLHPHCSPPAGETPTISHAARSGPRVSPRRAFSYPNVARRQAAMSATTEIASDCASRVGPNMPIGALIRLRSALE